MSAKIDEIESRDELRRRVNEAFDAARRRYGLTSDEALAERIGVSAKTISFWRNGRWHPAGEALIALLVGKHTTKEAA